MSLGADIPSRDICTCCVRQGIRRKINSWRETKRTSAWIAEQSVQWVERLWIRGITPCNITQGPGISSDIEKPPPEWCPRKFEHAVAAGMTNAL